MAEVVGGAILPRLHRHGTEITKKDKGSSQLISMSNFVSVIIAFSLLYLVPPCCLVGSSILVSYDGLRNCAPRMVHGSAGEFLLGDSWCSRGTEGSGNGPLSTGASSLIHRMASDLDGTRISITVLGGYPFARADIRSGVRLPDLCRGESFGFRTRR